MWCPLPNSLRLHDAVKNGSDIRLAQPGELRDEAIVDGGAWSA
jgi:hypothetical protein